MHRFKFQESILKNAKITGEINMQKILKGTTNYYLYVSAPMHVIIQDNFYLFFHKAI